MRSKIHRLFFEVANRRPQALHFIITGTHESWIARKSKKIGDIGSPRASYYLSRYVIRGEVAALRQDTPTFESNDTLCGQSGDPNKKSLTSTDALVR
jgi:hypothetical protein